MRQWAILIGVNQYQNQMFQPLTCAQQDAQALHQALVYEAGFPAEQCLLMTDASPAISGRSTQPTRANLQNWLDLLAQYALKPGDTLWFFFSGYGISSHGRDYLVPLDGDPFALETTCILVSDIFNWLQRTVLPGLCLMAFDINRSQGNYSNENVGLQAAQLARKFAVPLMLSCHPGQYSREVSGLGHGLFTIALLDGLRYHQAATPATLMRFLGDRLPELGAYYYLPNQQPLCVCPPDKLHHPLLQSHFSSQMVESNNGNGNYATVTADDAISAASMAQVTIPSTSEFNDRFAAASSTLPSLQPQTATATSLTLPDPAIDFNQSAHSIPNGQSVHASAPHPASPSPGLTANLYELPPLPSPSLSTPVSQVPPAPASTEGNPAPRPENSSSNESSSESSSALWLPILFWGGLLSLGLIGSVLWRNWAEIQAPSPVSTPAPTPTGIPTTIASPTATPSDTPLPPAATTTLPTPPATPVSPVPSPDRPLDFNPAATPVPIVGQELLRKTRQMVLSDQATPYRDAIDVLKQVPSTDPAFAEAQQDIAVWSQRIFNIAQLRATQKQWDIAIMAADLVPADNSTLSAQAKAAIGQWCPAIQPLPATTFPLQKAKAICNQKPI